MRLIIAVVLCLVGLPVLASGYSESFAPAPNPADWTNTNTTWNTSNGDIRNDAVVNPGIAVYNKMSWEKNFDLNVKIYGDYPAAANRVGVVFGYTSATNYFQVMVSMTGTVALWHVVSGSEPASPIASNIISPLTADVWHQLQVYVNGTNVTVKVDGVTALSQIPITPQSGYIGVIARSNLGRFDEISVNKQLFKGSFTQANGSPVTIGPLYKCSPEIPQTPGAEKPRNCYADIGYAGTNEGPGQIDASGYQWPIRLWGGQGKLQFNSQNTADDVELSVDADIAHMTGRTGGATDALHQVLKRRQTVDYNPQIPYVIYPDTTKPQGDAYFRYWLKFDDNFDVWHMPWQFKTEDNSYRVSLFIETASIGGGDPCTRSSADATPRFVIRGDHASAQPIYWQVCNSTATVPVNRWFKLEIFFHRGSATEPGRVWVAADGNQIFNYTAADGLRHPSTNTSPIDRVMFPQLYVGYKWARHQWVDDVELWDGIPADATPQN